MSLLCYLVQHSTTNITIDQNLKNNYNINCKTNIVPIFKKTEILLKYLMNYMYLLPLNLCHVVEISRALRFEIFKKYGNISEIFDVIFQNKKYRIFTSLPIGIVANSNKRR